MADDFEYISRTRLVYRNGLRHAYLGDVPEPVVYGVQGALREYYGAPERPPDASTLDHIVAGVAGWMYGILRGALAGRKIPFDRDTYTAAVEGRIVGHGKAIRIRSIAPFTLSCARQPCGCAARARSVASSASPGTASS
jgi:hypothetical protein